MFQSGDGRAFEDLYRRYFQRVYRYCLKRVGDPHEAEELAQEAFVRAYSAMPRFSGERRFYPWLSVIASRLCVDHHRRRSRTSPTPQVELGVVEGGQEDVIAQVDRDMLQAALDKMAPRHREVLRLREEEGWSYERIARHLDVRVGTIEALLFRARRALRREFHALAGVESRLAAIPVIGYLLRRLNDVRHKFGDLGAQAAPLAAAGAVSVAVVVGTVVTGGGGSAPASQPTKAPVVPTLEMPALVTSESHPTPATEATGGGPAPVGISTPEAPPTNVPVEVTDVNDGRQKAEAQPVFVDLGDVFIGLDPAGVVSTE